MERKVARAQGERSQEETQKLNKEIEDFTAEQLQNKAKLSKLLSSNKQLEDEDRIIKRKIETLVDSKDTLQNTIDELVLINRLAEVDLSKVTQQKEKTLVQHDIMKLEIQGLREKVNQGADKVYGFENRKYQLEMSMEEREKEIQVHKDILISELKAAQEERHKVKVELQQRYNKVKNLRIKYEGLIARNKSTSGE